MPPRLLLVAGLAVIIAAVVAGVLLVSETDRPVRVRAAEPTDDPRTVLVTYVGPAPECAEEPEVDVDEDDEEVRVTVSVATVEGPCPAVGVLAEVAVQLDEPLAERTVVDGTDGRPLLVPAG